MSDQNKPEIVAPESASLSSRIFNGLYAAVFGSGSFPGLNFGGPGTQQVSQLNPLFNNLRWYFASNWRQQLAEAYCELGLLQTIVDVPVDDGLRGGVEIASKEFSPEALQQLHDMMEREDDVLTTGQAIKWTRLFGGGALIILTDQDWEMPLDENTLFGAKLGFHAVDMWELYYDMDNTDGYDEMIQDEKFEFYSYYGKKVHKSRVIKMRGLVAPSFLRPRLRGWGLSVVEITVRSINQYLKGTNLIYELLDEAKIDVFGINNLTSTLLRSGGTEQIAARIQLANRQKNFQHALVMDALDTYNQKSLTFSGLADVMREVRYQVAADLRMPLTKIFGMGAQGFNSGEDDIEVYNGMVESSVRSKARSAFIRIAQLRCCQLFGAYPADLSASFQPMRLLPAETEQISKKAKYDRLSDAYKMGAMTIEEFRMACNKDDLLEIQLDPDAEGVGEPIAEEGSDTEQDAPGEEAEDAKPAGEDNKDESPDEEGI